MAMEVVSFHNQGIRFLAPFRTLDPIQLGWMVNGIES